MDLTWDSGLSDHYMGERVGRGLLVGCKVRVMDSVGLRVRGRVKG